MKGPVVKSQASGCRFATRHPDVPLDVPGTKETR